MIKNSNYAVQRMEMLAIYFALSDNRKYLTLTKFVKGTITKNLKIQIRSDSKSTIEQLIGKCEIKDALIQRICDSISRLLERIPQSIKFSHVKRSKNIAGILLDEKRRSVRDTRIYMTSFLKRLFIFPNHVGAHHFSLSAEGSPMLFPAELNPVKEHPTGLISTT